MGDKKRKSVTTGSELPKKKSKISVDDNPNLNEDIAKSDSSAKPQDTTHSTSSITPPAPAAAGSKKSPKRAADFLSDNDDEAPEVSSSKQPPTEGSALSSKAAHAKEKRRKKKARKDAASASRAAETLTADGSNGVRETKDSAQVRIGTAKKPAAKSMQAEAQRTADQELEDEWGGFGGEKEGTKSMNDEDDAREGENGAYLLEGFDSDSSDKEDKDYDGKTPEVPKKGRKLLKALEDKSLDNETGVVYLGRIPHGFYEDEMRGYLGQYGDITRLRVSRNKRTGASKHFAFVEFASIQVARIVAEANNNYMMFGHRLKCSVVADPAKLHKDLWKGANKKFRRMPHEKIERDKLAAPKSVDVWEKKNKREQKKRDKNAEKLKEIGYAMPEVKLRDPKDVVELAKRLEQESVEAVKASESGETEGSEGPTKAIEVAKETAPQPATESKDATTVVEGVVREDVAETGVADKEATATTNGDVKNTEEPSKLTKKEKKAKKAKKAEAGAEAKGTNGEATNAKTEASTETKQNLTPPSGAKSTNDAKLSSKNKPEKHTESSQQKLDVTNHSLFVTSDLRKEHKKNERSEREGKGAKRTKEYHAPKEKRLAKEHGEDVGADKKAKKEKVKKSKSAM